MNDPAGSSAVSWGITKQDPTKRFRLPCSQATVGRWGCDEVFTANGIVAVRPLDKEILPPHYCASTHMYVLEPIFASGGLGQIAIRIISVRVV
jgi:hypothetical protein